MSRADRRSCSTTRSDKMAQGGRRTLAGEFAGVRTGRAAPALVEKLKVDYYGTEVPLQQLAGFRCPRPACS